MLIKKSKRKILRMKRVHFWRGGGSTFLYVNIRKLKKHRQCDLVGGILLEQKSLPLAPGSSARTVAAQASELLLLRVHRSVSSL
jgi:hypothetical protein